MRRREFWAVAVLPFVSAIGVAYMDDRGTIAGATKSTERNKGPDPGSKSEHLKPWQPVDASFNGCSEGFCGARGQNSKAIVQPGAKVGDYTYCLVSGAVFRITESHFHAEVAGKTVYFCCQGCSRYFAANGDRVLKVRGVSL
jgi:YHS domain-containing protein